MPEGVVSPLSSGLGSVASWEKGKRRQLQNSSRPCGTSAGGSRDVCHIQLMKSLEWLGNGRTKVPGMHGVQGGLGFGWGRDVGAAELGMPPLCAELVSESQRLQPWENLPKLGLVVYSGERRCPVNVFPRETEKQEKNALKSILLRGRDEEGLSG